VAPAGVPGGVGKRAEHRSLLRIDLPDFPVHHQIHPRMRQPRVDEEPVGIVIVKGVAIEALELLISRRDQRRHAERLQIPLVDSLQPGESAAGRDASIHDVGIDRLLSDRVGDSAELDPRPLLRPREDVERQPASPARFEQPSPPFHRDPALAVAARDIELRPPFRGDPDKIVDPVLHDPEVQRRDVRRDDQRRVVRIDPGRPLQLRCPRHVRHTIARRRQGQPDDRRQQQHGRYPVTPEHGTPHSDDPRFQAGH